jgi:MoaD family protein
LAKKPRSERKVLNVRVKLIGVLRNLAGRDSLEIEIQEGRTVAQVLEKIIDLVGRTEFEAAIVDRELKNPTSNILTIVNNKDIGALNGLKTQLKNSDEIVLIPISHGG